MKKFLFLFLLVYSYSAWAQRGDEDMNITVSIPEDQAISTEAIAGFIKQHFTTERAKVNAIYGWVTNNIRYDLDSANIINLGTDPSAKITAALRRRKGVCENFSSIFNDICVKSGIKSFVVPGYTKQNGVVDKSGHSWCAVNIDNNWLLCDPTWDAGGGSRRFFLVPPADMIETHMPFDPMWQLLDHPVSHRAFYAGNTFRDKSQPLFNYTDSIAAYLVMDSLERFRSSALRIQSGGLYNNMVRNGYELNRMQVEMIRQDKDVDLYNASVADLNEITAMYNNFVQYRNRQFTPALPDKSLQALLDSADDKFADAYKKILQIAGSAATFQFSTDDLKQKLDLMAGRINDQKKFLDRYIHTPVAERPSLFYSKHVTVGK